MFLFIFFSLSFFSLILFPLQFPLDTVDLCLFYSFFVFLLFFFLSFPHQKAKLTPVTSKPCLCVRHVVVPSDSPGPVSRRLSLRESIKSAASVLRLSVRKSIHPASSVSCLCMGKSTHPAASISRLAVGHPSGVVLSEVLDSFTCIQLLVVHNS